MPGVDAAAQVAADLAVVVERRADAQLSVGDHRVAVPDGPGVERGVEAVLVELLGEVLG